MKTLEEACEAALDAVRKELSETAGNEGDAYRYFLDRFGGEIAGWEMRLHELDEEDA